MNFKVTKKHHFIFCILMLSLTIPLSGVFAAEKGDPNNDGSIHLKNWSSSEIFLGSFRTVTHITLYHDSRIVASAQHSLSPNRNLGKGAAQHSLSPNRNLGKGAAQHSLSPNRNLEKGAAQHSLSPNCRINWADINPLIP